MVYPPQFSSVAQSGPTLWTPRTAACQASLSTTNSWSLPKLMSIESVMPSNHLILCHPLLLLPPIAPRIRVFSSESALHIRWSKYWSFTFNISPSNEHPGLISFRMDWLDLLAVQGTLKSLLQHHSSKGSILWCSAFFTVQLLHPDITTGKTIALTRWAFVDKVMSLLFNMLSRLVITFLPRSKCLLISRLVNWSLKKVIYSTSCPSSRWCHPTISSSIIPLPSILPSIRVFSSKSVLHIRWPKYWSFSFNISPNNEYPGLISFRMDWLDLLAVQGTLRSLLQHHSSKDSILPRSALWSISHIHTWLLEKP